MKIYWKKKTSALLAMLMLGMLALQAPVAMAAVSQWPGNGNYYEVVNVPGDIEWPDAKVQAEARIYQGTNGYLATMTSQEENDFVKNIMLTGGLWVGGFQSAEAEEPGGDWQWVTGEPFNYINWDSGEPNDLYQVQDYLQMYTSGLWDDAQSWFKLSGFIVEYEGDYTAPDTQITSGPSGTITTNSATFTYTGTGSSLPLSYEYKLDEGVWTGYSSATSAILNNLAAGAHTFYVRAKDAVGNIDATPASQAFTYTAPASTPTTTTPPTTSQPAPAPVKKAKKTILSTALTLKASKNVISLGTTITLTGSLKDVNGKGIAGKKISLRTGSGKIGNAVTDSKGRFKINTQPQMITKFKRASHYSAYFKGNKNYRSASAKSKKINVKK